MSEADEQNEAVDTADTGAQDVDAAVEGDPAADMNADGSAATPEVHPAEFPEVVRTRNKASTPLERFSVVQVEISVELGRVSMSIGELLHLGQGSVVELDRELNEPVAVMAQGVRIASGEVVVIDERFAVKITEITETETAHAGDSSVMEAV
jgi:flagellar motor switch protein FliN/FliY